MKIRDGKHLFLVRLGFDVLICEELVFKIATCDYDDDDDDNNDYGYDDDYYYSLIVIVVVVVAVVYDQGMILAKF